MKRLTTILAYMAFPLALFAQNAKNYNLLIGTYTKGKSEGIYVYQFNPSNGSFSYKNKATGVENPSFLTISPDKNYVYAVNETTDGAVSAFKYDRKSGGLEFINKVPSGGADPCYISTDKTGKNILVANYSGGSLSVIPVNKDKSIGQPIQTIQHEGHGINKERQEKAHVHSTVFAPDYSQLLVGDLGQDKVVIYDYNAEQARPLSPARPPFISITPGAGPRHITFHPNGRFLYVVEELGAQVAAFNYNKGKVTPIQTISLLSAGATGQVGAADIHVSPDGKFLYASNRGEINDIAIYSIDQKSGKLKHLGNQSAMGKAPRNFAIDPTGQYLLVANQDSDNIVLFKRDKKTGLLTDTGTRLEVGMPVCLAFTAQE